MKHEQIEIGGTYLTKVGIRDVEVRISRANPKGGWDAASVASGKPIRVADAARLRPVKAKDTSADEQEAPGEESQVPAPKKAKAAKVKKVAAPKKAAAPKEPKSPGKMSALDAAAAVLKASGGAMNCKSMIETMASKGLWTSTAPTPAATLSSAILREMTVKKEASRFKKVDRGQFAFNTDAAAKA